MTTQMISVPLDLFKKLADRHCGAFCPDRWDGEWRHCDTCEAARALISTAEKGA